LPYCSDHSARAFITSQPRSRARVVGMVDA
jgi:hypothetical protein